MKAKFIVGLGNPGQEYKGTRHNIGFEILDALTEVLKQSGEQLVEASSKKLYSKTISFPVSKTTLIYPQTFMNLSGRAVRAIYDWYKLKDLSNFLVIHDDLSLPVGQMRWVTHGGAGGQHGVESIIEYFGGSKLFARLKFGIGPDPGGEKRSQYVLSQFDNLEKPILNKTINSALEALTLFIQEKPFTEIMNRYNGLKLNNEVSA
jgi:peptidyl-tRNA hydrolase, PTH1 family